MFEPDHGRGRLHGRSLYDALGSDFMVPAESTIHAVLDRYGLAKRGGGLRASPPNAEKFDNQKTRAASFLFVRRGTQSYDEFIAAVPLSASPEHDARDDQHVRHFLDWRKRKCVCLVGSALGTTPPSSRSSTGMQESPTTPHVFPYIEGERVKLPNAETEPKAFWAEVDRRQSSAPTAYPAGSIGDLISRYRGSDEFTRLSEGTQSNYEVTKRRFEAHDTWDGVGQRPDTACRPDRARRDERNAGDGEPDAFGRAHDLGLGHPAWPGRRQSLRQGERLRHSRPHVPWPSWVVDYVRAHAWPDLVRMERLGI
jgi:hypothetical protein